MATTYSGRKFTVGDDIYFSKFGTAINASSYASASGTKGTCHGKVTALYESSYNFPIVISGTITAGTGGSFTGAAVKPADCSKGYQVTVTYSHNGGSGTTSQTGYVGKSLSGTSSREGYSFLGWFKSTASTADKVTTIPKDKATYYAHWSAKKYAVTLNQQSGSGGTTSVTATYNSSMPSITKPSRTGYTFQGYYASTGGSGTKYYTSSGSSNHSWDQSSAKTIYAYWTQNSYTVQFDGNGATSGSMDNQSFSYGTTKALSSNAFSKGASYAFTGWNTKADGTGTTVASDYSASTLSSTNGATVTLYAQWELTYVAPIISNLSAQRYTKDEQNNYVPDVEGGYLHVSFGYEVDTNVFSDNYMQSYAIDYRESDTETWTPLIIVESPEYSTHQARDTVEYTYSSPNLLDKEKSYDVRIRVNDYYGYINSIPMPHSVAMTFISQAFFTMDFAAGGKGIGIGSPAPDEGLLVGMNVMFKNMAGVMQMYGGTTPPNGWLLCDGSEYLISDYPELYSIIGDTFSLSASSGCFQVPDMCGRVPVGVGTGTATDATAHTLGQKDGTENHTLTEGQLPNISGTINFRGWGTTNGALAYTPTGKFSTTVSENKNSTVTTTSSSNSARQLTFEFGSGQSHPNMQPYLGINFIICTGRFIQNEES